MTAGIYDIICEQGSTFQQVLTCTDSGGNLINWTGYSAAMQVRKNKEDETAILSLSSANNTITLGIAAGTISLYISATNTAVLIPGIYYYDLQISVYNSTVGENIVARLIEGTFTVIEEVTR